MLLKCLFNIHQETLNVKHIARQNEILEYATVLFTRCK